MKPEEMLRTGRWRWGWLAALAVLALGLTGCTLRDLGRGTPPTYLDGRRGRDFVLETTGYCACGECCNWRRNWLLRPVIASGAARGQRKAVGITAAGTRARPGTIAADTRLFPFGTLLYIPGYGYGKVEDRGGDIQGYHIDLFFRSHEEAREWGRVRKRVRVWFPPSTLTARRR